MTTTTTPAADALTTTLAAREITLAALRTLTAIEAKGTKVSSETRGDLIADLAWQNRKLADLGYAG